jgi:hypothetical protein
MKQSLSYFGSCWICCRELQYFGCLAFLYWCFLNGDLLYVLIYWSDSVLMDGHGPLATLPVTCVFSSYYVFCLISIYRQLQLYYVQRFPEVFGKVLSRLPYGLGQVVHNLLWQRIIQLLMWKLAKGIWLFRANCLPLLHLCSFENWM